MSENHTEQHQRAFAEHMGVSWDAYTARAKRGVSLNDREAEGWYLRFAWRPQPAPHEPPPADYDDGRSEARDREHNARILAAIPHTEPVPPDDILTQAVARYGHEGMQTRFFSPLAVEVRRTMQGYIPVFDEHGLPVVIGGGLMMCERPVAPGAPPEPEMETEEEVHAWSGPRSYGDGDTFRVMWGAFGWRGVFAFYRFTPHESREKKRGIELMTQRRGRDPNSVRIGFYRRREL